MPPDDDCAMCMNEWVDYMEEERAFDIPASKDRVHIFHILLSDGIAMFSVKDYEAIMEVWGYEVR